MKKRWKITALVGMLLCLPVLCGPAFAWELALTGNWNWEYKWYSMGGPKGFFGQFDVDQSTIPGQYAAANGWLGNEIMFDQVTSGSDASASTMYINFSPEITINPAIRIRGSYYIGSWQPGATTGGGALHGNWNAPEYFTNTINGVQSSFSPGYWNTFWATAQTPWGIIVLGKRPFSFGTGLILNGADNTTYEGLLIVAPYGPLRVGGAWMPWTQGSPAGTYVLADKNGVQDYRVGGFVTYDQGPLSFGILTEYLRVHVGPESAQTQAARLVANPTDVNFNYWVAFMKYFNGRFFANVEAAYIDVANHFQASLVGVGLAPSYTQHTRYMAELGCISGASKVSLLWAWIDGGIDRRAGAVIDRQADTRPLTFFSNYSVFRQYSILLAWNYGGGNASYTSGTGGVLASGARGVPGSDNGYLTDVNLFGARMDYSVAANLNAYASFIWADRISAGYGWGYITPGVTPAVATVTPNTVQYFVKAGSPNIPDNNLGWEVNAGFDWQILDGYTISAAWGYWQPGKWFSYACIDRSVLGWDVPTAGNFFGANPSRKIDPVYGMDLVVKAEF